MANIDPYNNAPPGKCGGGSCSSKSAPASQQQYVPQGPPPSIPQYSGRTTGMSRRPANTPGGQAPPPMPQQPDPQAMINMLRSDLNVAIQYIQQLGGRWPPPGH